MMFLAFIPACARIHGTRALSRDLRSGASGYRRGALIPIDITINCLMILKIMRIIYVHHSCKNLGPAINPEKIKINQSISKLCCDGNYETDSVSLSNLMNNYFCRIANIFNLLQETIIPHILPDIEIRFSLSSTSVQETEPEIKSLNIKNIKLKD